MGWSGCLKDVWVKTFSEKARDFFGDTGKKTHSQSERSVCKGVVSLIWYRLMWQKIKKNTQKTPPLINLSRVLTGTHSHLVFFPGHCASWPDQPQSRCVAPETAQWMSYARCFGGKGRKSLQIILGKSGLESKGSKCIESVLSLCGSHQTWPKKRLCHVPLLWVLYSISER